jgi:hypothetical protein
MSGFIQGSLKFKMQGGAGKDQKSEGMEKERLSLKMISVINSLVVGKASQTK